MNTARFRRRDGSIFDAPVNYVLQDGESAVRAMPLMDGAQGGTLLTDEQVLNLVRAEMRPNDTSRLSAAQLRRAFVAMKLGAAGGSADEMLAKSDSYIEGAFKALTSDMSARHMVSPDIAEMRGDGTVRDSATVVRDSAGFVITDAHARARGYGSATDLVKQEERMTAEFDVQKHSLGNAWQGDKGDYR